jgi:hypothetical protein
MLPKNLKTNIYKTMILHVLYGCDTWSLILGDLNKLRVLESGMLRGIFGPGRNEVTRGWRKHHNKSLHNLCCSPDIEIVKSKRMMYVGQRGVEKCIQNFI